MLGATFTHVRRQCRHEGLIPGFHSTQYRIDPAFLHATSGRRSTVSCAAAPRRTTKSSRIQKGGAKKPPSMGKNKVTLTDEQKQQIDALAKAHIEVTDSPSYIQKLKLNTHSEESSPYLTLFESEKLTKDDLVGIDLPFGLVPPDRYELWKLCGHVCDPLPVISSQSMTPKQFTQRLFGKNERITRDEFNYNIEYKMRFYAPGYGDIFLMDKVRCWRAWFLFRGLKEGREDLPTYHSIHQIARPKDEVPLSAAMLSVNYEVNRQGVHPALLDMLWDFFTDNNSVIRRDEVTAKLNWVVDRLPDLDPGEGISPDNFYKIFIEPAREYLAKFDKEAFAVGANLKANMLPQRQQLRKIHEQSLRQKVLSNNKALRQRYKILTSAYLDEIRSMYKVPTPEFYKQYERRRLTGYFNLLADMQERRMRRRAMSKEKLDELKAAKADAPVQKKKKREKKPSKRNKKLGRGVMN
ncbi:hypothetical protein, conserved [Babesia bigemina]|uniref:Uncharacterized protein n=1 Tax=Babesia bigemina TaxID=5866 RepID=A0A061D702_BABBI|nr:hypothetical protein, conserved [Babesia bigemina]CDR95772.1 hypothetical protein, conserved [Babesia bigemina]|eukprot:XP_012767958.1 hypothetical protein, conserved [Babesia bigemina]